MNIAIDLTSVPKSKAGVGRYVSNLVSMLQKVDSSNNYYLFVQDDDLDGFNIKARNFNVIRVNSKLLRNTLLRLLWEQFVLPVRLKRYKIDLLHCPHYTMPYLTKVPCVVVFHDMTFFLMPQVHTLLKRIMFKFYIRFSAKKSSSIISVSQSTAEDIKKILHIDDNKISVCPLGVDERFFNNKNPGEETLKHYEIQGDYFLYVGTIEPRKNILRLLKAYNGLNESIRSKYKLIICGGRGWMYDEIFKYIEQNHLENNVRFTGFVKDEDLPCIYKGAKLFLYVSLYEGFGIPIIEAMASGVPCITSNLSSMAEVAGECAVKVDPYSEDEIRLGIKKLLEDKNLYNDFSLKGKERAQLYTWEECAQKTLNVYLKYIN